MKTNRGVLVIVLIAITILMISCQPTIIIPKRYYHEEKFKFWATFRIDLSDLNSLTLKTILDAHKDEILFENLNLDSDYFNFDKFLVTSRDQTMFAVIYEITTLMESEEIITFIKEHSGQFPDVQGLILAWEQGKDLFPPGKFVAGFSNKKNKLWEGYGKSHGVTCISRKVDQDGWLFDVGCYEHSWYKNYCILFFVSEEDIPKLFSH